jgi:two-component system OmpR family sensor kinase
MKRDKIKTELLVHDLKVPLVVIEAGINSLLKKLDEYGPLTEKQEKILMRMLRNTKLMQMLVNDVLELGRSRAGIATVRTVRLSDFIGPVLVELFDLIDYDTSEKIKSCVDLTQLKKALEEKDLQLFIDESLWCQEICLDDAKAKQVLRNLLNNALKYRKERVELTIDEKDGSLVLSIKDDGEGIPPIYHKKIFKSYFQMDPTDTPTVRGHGLGLAGAMVLVEDMNGELLLESDEGRGVTFLVKVPLAATSWSYTETDH